jgi:hypothetical protein
MENILRMFSRDVCTVGVGQSKMTEQLYTFHGCHSAIKFTLKEVGKESELCLYGSWLNAPCHRLTLSGREAICPA